MGKSGKKQAKTKHDAWAEAIARNNLTPRQVRMARVLNFTPKSMKSAGKNRRGRLSLGEYITELYAQKYPHSEEGKAYIARRRQERAQRKQARRSPNAKTRLDPNRPNRPASPKKRNQTATEGHNNLS